MENKVAPTATLTPSVKLKNGLMESKKLKRKLFACDQENCDCTFTKRRKLISHVRLHLDEVNCFCYYSDKNDGNSL